MYEMSTVVYILLRTEKVPTTNTPIILIISKHWHTFAPLSQKAGTII